MNIKLKSKYKRNLFIILTLGPGFLAYCLFTLWPNLLSAYYSFFEWNGVSEPRFVGFYNFIKLATDKLMYRSFGNNFLMAAIIPVTVVFVSLILAYLIANKNYKENKFYRILFFFPNIIPVVLLALLWAFIYDGDIGLFNQLLKIFGIDVMGKYWLADQKLAIWALMVPLVWSGVGFSVIIYVNAMAAIPKSLYEAATLEGASHIKKLRLITFPLISGSVKVTYIFLILSAFKNFDFIMLMTNGGPANATETVGLYIYHMAFGATLRGTQHFGYASALGMVLCIFFILFKIFLEKVFKDPDVQY